MGLRWNVKCNKLNRACQDVVAVIVPVKNAAAWPIFFRLDHLLIQKIKINLCNFDDDPLSNNFAESNTYLARHVKI